MSKETLEIAKERILSAIASDQCDSEFVLPLAIAYTELLRAEELQINLTNLKDILRPNEEQITP